MRLIHRSGSGHLDGVDLSEVAVAGQFAGETETADERCCVPVWNTRSFSPHGIADCLTLLNGHAEWLLAVDVLACLGRRDGDHSVPVILRRDADGIDVFASEHVAKVAVRAAVVVSVLLVHNALGLFATLLKDVADSHDLDAFNLHQLLHVAFAHRARHRSIQR